MTETKREEMKRLIDQLDDSELARFFGAIVLLLMSQPDRVSEADRRTCLTLLGRVKLGRHEAYQVIAGRKALEPAGLEQLARRVCRV